MALLPGRAGADPVLDQGYRRYNSVCSHCHGPDGVGSTFAPSLVHRPLAPDLFRDVVANGRATGDSVMKGFGGDPNVAPYIEATTPT